MADDTTNTATEPRLPNGLESVKDGTSNTVLFEENQRNSNAQAPRTNEVVVIAQRDSATGETTLVEGKSTGGNGPVQISGTSLTFEDKAEFDQFLADVNAKEDAGVPFEEIIGNAVNAIPVVEDGVSTGETLGGIVTAPPPGEPIVIGGDSNQDAGASPEPNGRQGGRVPDGQLIADSEGSGILEDQSPDGAGNRAPDPVGAPFEDRDGNGVKDGFEDQVNRPSNGAPPPPFAPPAGVGVQDVPLTGPAVDGTNGAPNAAPADTNGADAVRQPGRDADGNLLPGAEGRVTLDDFNRINDRDGNGINDGVENPVDLGGNGVQNGTNGEAHNGGAHHGDQGHGERRPGRDADGNLLPGAEGRVTLDDFVRINDRDGNGIIDGIENPVDMRGDRPGFEPPTVRPGLEIPGDLRLPEPGPTFEPGGDGTPDIPGRGPTVVIDPVFPVAPQPPAGHNEGHGNNGGAVAEPPPLPTSLPPAQSDQAATVEEPPAAFPAPAGPIDTFETGTTPAVPEEAPLATAAAEETPAAVATPVAYASAEPAVEAQSPEAPDASTPDYIGRLDVVGAAAGLAPFGPGNSATDVFDAETIRAAASTAVAGTTEEGGANLLERIFDKVKDILFESGPSSPSPVQLPQTFDQAPDVLASRSDVAISDSVASFEVEEAQQPDDDQDDGLQ